MDKGLYQQIRKIVDLIKLVDTHEHIIPERERIRKSMDVFSLVLHYPTLDLRSAGMSVEQERILHSSEAPLKKKWEVFAPFWEEIKLTGYGQYVLIAVRDLFGGEDITRANYKKLSEKVASANKKGWYRKVMKQKAGIDLAVLNVLENYTDEKLHEVDRMIFAPVARDTLQKYTILHDRTGLDIIEEENDISIHTLNDLLRAMDVTFAKAIDAGVVGIKNSAAYDRTILWEKVSFHDAERVFSKIFSGLGEGPSMADAKPLQDYLFHQMIQRAIAADLPIQIHTGIHARNACIVTDSKPTHLINLFMEYREARFDIFHAGYPYISELTTLAKNFPCVNIDLCWMPILSPTVAKQALHEWIEMIPLNKIFAFGGDCVLVEGSYAHSVMARDIVSKMLVERIESGDLTEPQAEVVANKILRENPYNFFRLDKYKKKYHKAV